jgi:hypothetical protein
MAVAAGAANNAASKGGGQGTDTRPILPDAARKAIKDEFPNGMIMGIKQVTELGVSLYAVTVEGSLNTFVLEVTGGGLISEVDGSKVEAKDVPDAAMKGIQGATDGGVVTRFLKGEQRAEVKDVDGTPTMVKLDKPKTIYKAELAKVKQVAVVKVDADGRVMQPVVWTDKPVPPAPPSKKR